LPFPHPYSITIGENLIIDENLFIHQNMTIGFGRGSMNIIIGDNVYIDAMSFVNKEIPDNCTVYTQKNKYNYLARLVITVAFLANWCLAPYQHQCD
jgi:serine acetyltransferase